MTTSIFFPYSYPLSISILSIYAHPPHLHLSITLTFIFMCSFIHHIPIHLSHSLPFLKPTDFKGLTTSWHCIGYHTSHYTLFLSTTPSLLPTHILAPHIPNYETIPKSHPVHLFTVEYLQLYPPLPVITHSLFIFNNVIINEYDNTINYITFYTDSDTYK